ncbi:hypothetical protein [Amycolatopsis granulosa]|uniref:hypothetical protein n=1 Tax=Amycolatopsis granulosa TaxID=185684 RepID=UPI00141F2310|nr:hypothetical protein [Amycolatopsis granulosa]NIH84543.1 hypothetical protein [Amycolatopsis granulosa]
MLTELARHARTHGDQPAFSFEGTTLFASTRLGAICVPVRYKRPRHIAVVTALAAAERI